MRDWVAEGRSVAVGRVVGISGFSTWPGDEMLAVDDRGVVAGAVLGSPGTAQLRQVMADGLVAGVGRRRLTIEIHGKAVVEAELSCGGQADVLVEPAVDLPGGLWDALAGGVPVALVTSEGGTPTLVVAGAPVPDSDEGRLGAEALASGHSAVRVVEVAGGPEAVGDPVTGGPLLVEAWVPTPRLVVVGDGDLVAALASQGALLGWDTVALERPDGLADALTWAGGTAAVVVLSHDPHVDVPVLRAALEAGAAYVGAMGSRRTQSRRMTRLAEEGVSQASAERIHRPVGLDLGGRSAPEVAMAICAEILAVRTGRDGGSLRNRPGPIHERPAARG